MKIYTFRYILINGRNCCFLTAFLLISVFADCNPGQLAAQPVQADTTRKRSETGLASYYAKSLQGEATASGESFDNRYMVAAHPTYPLGTVVQVTNLKNDHTVQVRINDRGPTKRIRKRGVIIDLSWAAAKKLNMLEDGRAKVRVDVVEWGNDEKKKKTIIGKVIKRDRVKEKVNKESKVKKEKKEKKKQQ